jgi:hypothetical protein
MAQENSSIENSSHSSTASTDGDKGLAIGERINDYPLLPVNPTTENGVSSHTTTENKIDVGGWLCL